MSSLGNLNAQRTIHKLFNPKSVVFCRLGSPVSRFISFDVRTASPSNIPTVLVIERKSKNCLVSVLGMNSYLGKVSSHRQPLFYIATYACVYLLLEEVTLLIYIHISLSLSLLLDQHARASGSKYPIIAYIPTSSTTDTPKSQIPQLLRTVDP